MKIINLKGFFVFILFCLLHKIALSGNLSSVDSLLKVLANTKEDTIRLKTYLSLCEINEPEDNLKYAEPALQLADRLLSQTNNDKQRKDIIDYKAKAYKFLGYYYEDIHDSVKEFFCYQKVLYMYREAKDDEGVVNAILKISRYYSDQGNIPIAIEYFQKGLKLAQLSKDKKIIADCYLNIATFYYKQSEFSQAIVNCQRGLSIYKELKDTLRIARIINYMSVMYRSMHDFKNALACMQEAMTLFTRIKNEEETYIIYNYYGLEYLDNNNYKKALENFKIALTMFEKTHNTNVVQGILGNIGDTYRKQGDIENALKYHYKALEVAKTRGDATMGFQFYRLAKDYFMAKDYGKAKLFTNKFLAVNKEIDAIDWISDAKLMLVHIDSLTGNYKDAFLHYQEYILHRDKMKNEDVRKAVIKEKFQAEYDEQKTREMLMQNKKDAIAQQQLQKQKLIRNTFIVGSILLLLVIVLLINRNQLKHKIAMEKMRNRLSRDLHDDIGSTLSSINILSRTAQTNLHHTGDEKTKSSLEKINERSQRLLDNMSDIIWNINPANDTIEEVMSRMREYATTILEAKNIDYVFNFPKEIMDCRLNMEVKNNMYLIFKEAVNNLSKYSGCTIAKLSLTFDEKNIHIKIEDNGKGFNDDETKHRGGLNNMQHRAEEIKGTIKINSVIERGTEIELTMPRYC
ncbi:MAG: tetratricopeptide repeat protein [Bacteroidia bacterium]